MKESEKSETENATVTGRCNHDREGVRNVGCTSRFDLLPPNCRRGEGHTDWDRRHTTQTLVGRREKSLFPMPWSAVRVRHEHKDKRAMRRWGRGVER